MFLGTRSLLRAVSAGRAASAAGPAVAQRRWMSEVAEDGAGWLPETPIRHTTLEEVEEQGIEWTPTGIVTAVFKTLQPGDQRLQNGTAIT
eukprot:gene11276-366_t